MKKTGELAVVAMVGLLVLTAALSGAEAKKAAGAPAVQAQKTVTGVVTVNKDGDKIKEVTIGTGAAMVCVCTTTEAGKKVADFAGKTVHATGTLAEKGGKKVLTVTKVEELQTVTGMVTVNKDGGKTKEVTIGTGAAMVCVCTTTEAGKKVADFAGKTVSATGTLAEKGGKKVLTIAKVEELKTVTGVVTVNKDGDKTKEVTIGKGAAMVCVCTTTEAGKKVADLAGKTVNATGTLAEKGGKKVLTVTEVEEVKAAVK
jgi:hypothetical protein